MTGATVEGSDGNVKRIAVRSAHCSQKTPTIHDVARLAGVSKSLVSRVMSGRGVVSETSRAAVLGAVDSLGYRPNAVARNLVARRTHTLGVLVSDLHNQFFAEVLDGVRDAAQSARHQVVIVSGDRDPEREAELTRTLVELRVDGIVLASPQLSERLIDELSHAVPVSVVARAVHLPRVDTAVNDDWRGAELVVEHLVELGHERIAMLGGADRPGARLRRIGYEETMARFGFTPDLVDGGYTEDDGYRAARVLLERPGALPTAVFAANDLAAVGALNAFDEAGLDVPADVSLVGFDNTAIAALRHVSLTTIHQDRRELGRRAAEAVLERYEERERRPLRVVLTPALVARRTSGPVRLTGSP